MYPKGTLLMRGRSANLFVVLLLASLNHSADDTPDSGYWQPAAVSGQPRSSTYVCFPTNASL